MVIAGDDPFAPAAANEPAEDANFIGEPAQGLDDFGQMDVIGEPAAFDPLDSDGAEPEQNGYAAIKKVDELRQEPEKIRLWREEQRDLIEKKDGESEKKMEEWRAAAKKELEDWYKHCDEQLEKRKTMNREVEAEFIQERDDNVPGHEWERICRLCEFNPKGTRTQKDVSRMRSILLQLKQTPLVR
ncbi:Clathrin light chain A [Lamellibrachia satsuma]|nr:Clathrin light chain A [Lamellibrachia satsuma]